MEAPVIEDRALADAVHAAPVPSSAIGGMVTTLVLLTLTGMAHRSPLQSDGLKRP